MVSRCICHYVIQVISVRDLRLFHNNSVKLQLIYLLLVKLYNLSIPNYCYYWSAMWLSTLTQLQLCVCLHCTVKSLKYVPVTSIIGRQFPEPDWVPVTISGAPFSMYPTVWTVPCFGTVQW